MNRLTIKTILACLAIAISAPVFADRDEHGDRHYRKHHRHDHDRGYFRDQPCRYKSWYDRNGNYHERRVCREQAQVMMPGPAVYVQPPQALVFRPPSVHIQPPGIYLR